MKSPNSRLNSPKLEKPTFSTSPKSNYITPTKLPQFLSSNTTLDTSATKTTNNAVTNLDYGYFAQVSNKLQSHHSHDNIKEDMLLNSPTTNINPNNTSFTSDHSEKYDTFSVKSNTSNKTYPTSN